MSERSIRQEGQERSARMLRSAMGADIAEWLGDPTVIEIMLKPWSPSRAR